jgi:hypothetical protein
LLKVMASEGVFIRRDYLRNEWDRIVL